MPIQYSRSINANALKVIAIITMFIDHTSSWLYPKGTILAIITHTIGRLAAPIICYLIAEGYFHTSNIKKYISRLFLFAIISHLPYVLYFNLHWWKATSVIWGLLLGLVALAVYCSPALPIIVKLIAVVLCCLFAWTADWNYIAVLWILFFGIFKGQLRWQVISFAVIGSIFYIYPIVELGVDYIYRFGILLTIPLFALYSGKKGKKSHFLKWSFYIFYPAHLLFLYILRYYIFV